MYNLITGIALLLASVLAGSLWTAFGPAATFFAGAGFVGIAVLGVVSWQPSHEANISNLS